MIEPEVIPHVINWIPIFVTVLLAHSAAILSLYVCTYSSNKAHANEVALELGKMYTLINKHFQTASIHVQGEDKFVPIDVCKALHQSLKDDVTEMKADIKILVRSNGA